MITKITVTVVVLLEAVVSADNVYTMGRDPKLNDELGGILVSRVWGAVLRF